MTNTMNDYRFTLDHSKPRKKYTCPQCGRTKCFTRYIDMYGQITFPDNVGICDHANSCFHYPPKDYFRDNPGICKEPRRCLPLPRRDFQVAPPKPRPVSYMNSGIVTHSMSSYNSNPLFRFLKSRIGEKETRRLFRLYCVGTSVKWDGSTVYWQIDHEGKVRAGKVIPYNPDTGHRIKFESGNDATWAHAILGMRDYNLCQCLFGEHLLASRPYTKVALVEGEKTAIIGAHFMPQYTWVATGGVMNFKTVEALAGFDVVVFPDLGASDTWKEKLTPILSPICRRLNFSDRLEKRCTSQHKADGLDIADFLISEETPESVWQQMVTRNHYLEDFRCEFKLEIVGIDSS